MIRTAAVGGMALLLAGSTLLFPLRAVEGKSSALTFDKVVILSGGGIEEAVEITEPGDLAGSALDKSRPTLVEEDLGTEYELVLYAAGSDVAFDVTYYASRRGDRGYIYQPEILYIGGGQISPGWSRPSQPLENTLRDYGAVMTVAGSGGGSVTPGTTVVGVAAAAAVVVGLSAATFARVRSRRLP